jgi:3-hydroxyisobutyrate dehydrogenase-like beta-hydroxyacid dehydrogenase
MTMHVGFIGTGNMGGGIARRMLDAGIGVTAYDINPPLLAPLRERGATIAASQREVADASEIVFASLPSPEICKQTALGPNGVSAGKRIKFYVETSTIGPDAIVAIAEGLSAAGIGVLDAPVSGGPKAAAAGTMAIITSGPRVVYEAVRPILELAASKVFYVGEKPGLAQMSKLVNNAISYASAGIAYEAVVLGVKAGLDAATLLDVINASTGRNRTTLEKFPKSILPRTFDFGGPLYVNLKDITLYLEQAEKLEVPSLIATSVAQLYRLAALGGVGRRDSTSVIQCIEKWAGVEVRGRAPGPKEEKVDRGA